MLGRITQMTEIDRIKKSISMAVQGDPWYGPALSELLKSVTANQATTHISENCHSIGEILMHIMSWHSITAERLGQRTPPKVTTEMDWPTLEVKDPSAWSESLDHLDINHRLLQRRLSSIDETRLLEMVSGEEYPVWVMLYGIIQHDAYHAGQIALLSKLLLSKEGDQNAANL
jgi:uncharacterized damage-inducible protein DinB